MTLFAERKYRVLGAFSLSLFSGANLRTLCQLCGAYYNQQLFTTFLQFPTYKVIIGSFLVLGFPPLPTHPELPPPSNLSNPIPPACACPPHWPWNLTSADLSNIESGDPQAANNNFSSCNCGGW